MGQDKLYYLDAMTKDEEYRITTFSYQLENLVNDFSRWIKEQVFEFDRVAYATLYRMEDDEPMADLVCGEDGLVNLVPREPNTGLLHRLILLLRRWRNRM